MTEQKIQVLLGIDRQTETIEALQVLEDMSREEQWELLYFLQGVRFAKRFEWNRDYF